MLNLILPSGKIVSPNYYQLYIIDQFSKNKICKIGRLPRRAGRSTVLCNLVILKLFEKLILNDTDGKIILASHFSRELKRDILHTIHNSDTIMSAPDVVYYAEQTIKYIDNRYSPTAIHSTTIDSIFCEAANIDDANLQDMIAQCAIRNKNFKALIIKTC